MTALAGHVGHRYPPPARHASVPQREDATTRRLVRLLALGVGAVLVVQGCAVAAARDGRFGFGLLLYYTTVLLPFVATVVLLVRGDLPARLRAGVVVVLGVVSTVLHRLTDPLLLTGFDEQLHLRTLNDLLAGAPLFAPNPLLSASPDYPGLELLTVFLQRATGLPTMVAVTAVVLACRVVLVLGIYQLATLLTGDARTGSVAVAFYAASPQFYFFNSQYAYQTLAVSLALGGLGVVARACVAGSGRRALGALAVLCFAGVTVTHHLTGWATLVGLLVWAVLAPDRNRRLVWGVAGATAAVVAAWTVPMAAELVRYLGPVFAAAWDQVSSLLHGGAHRSMFHDSAGSATPLWERAVLLGYAGAYTVLAAVTGVVLLRRARRYGDRVSLVLALVCLAYPAIFATRVTPMAADVGDRSTTFVFVPLALGVALLLRSWWYRRGAGTAVRSVVTLGIVALSTLGYFGGLVLGSGPDWGRLPGGYLVAADSRSLDPETLAAVEWSAAHLAPGQSIMADRMPATLLASRARLWLVASPTAGVEPAGLYFATTWGPEQVRTARAARLRYLYVDTRLAGSGPHEGWYFYPGETPDQRRLTAPALAKFATARGLTAVYRHGPVSIYDLRALAGTPSPRGWTGAWHRRPWLDAGAGLLAGLLLAWRWVGLRRRFGPLLHAAGGAGATAGAMAAVLLVTGVATAVSFRPGWQFSVALVVP
ncbi:MAG TPA: hypothetical protein VJT31_26410, partial [Rugosimonospora sp.]|nr:hypothetical protein [Rugosimonospora sp.]